LIAYVDSSVLLRMVLGQRDRLKEWKLIEQAIASALVEVECLRTLDRLRHHQDLPAEGLVSRREAVFRLLAEFSVVAPSRQVFSRAAQPFPTPLGTLDAIHLATALLWKERGPSQLVMATHDAALATAARASGLEVLGHPS
jgi:predicted nucleic acid-binding protein